MVPKPQPPNKLGELLGNQKFLDKLFSLKTNILTFYPDTKSIIDILENNKDPNARLQEIGKIPDHQKLIDKIREGLKENDSNIFKELKNTSRLYYCGYLLQIDRPRFENIKNDLPNLDINSPFWWEKKSSKKIEKDFDPTSITCLSQDISYHSHKEEPNFQTKEPANPKKRKAKEMEDNRMTKKKKTTKTN